MSKVGRIINLGSSSEGNSIYLEILRNGYEKPFNILLDVGFSYNEMLRKMIKNKIDVNNIDAILVTHEHGDHSKSMTDFWEKGINVYAPETVFYKSTNPLVFQHQIMVEYEWREIEKGIEIFSFPLEHFDKGEKIYNLGYIIKIDNEYQILFATDTKFLPQDFSAFEFDMIFIEANYLEDKVTFALRDAQRKGNKANIARYKRLVDSHFSLENLARTLSGDIKDGAKPFNLSKCEAIFLLHLSSGNDTNESYYKTFLQEYIKVTQYKTQAKDNIKIIIMGKDGGFK